MNRPAVVGVGVPLEKWTVETMQAAVECVGYLASTVPHGLLLVSG